MPSRWTVPEDLAASHAPELSLLPTGPRPGSFLMP